MSAETEFTEDELYRLIFQTSRDAIGLAKNGLHIKANPALVALLGYEEEAELLGTSVIDFVAPEEQEKTLEIMAGFAEGKPPPDVYQTIGIRKDGTKFILEVKGSIYVKSSDIYILVILRDITENYIKEQLITMQRNIGDFLNSSDEMDASLLFILNELMKIDYVDCVALYLIDEENQRVDIKNYFGVSKEFIQQAITFWNRRENFHRVMEGAFVYSNFASFFEGEQNFIFNKEEIKAVALLPIKYHDRVVSVLNLGSKHFDAMPEAIEEGLESVALQIGRAIARIQAEEELRESEEKYRSLVENSPDAICILQDNLVQFCNQVASEKTGYDFHELIGKPFLDLLAAEERPVAEDRLARRWRGENLGSYLYTMNRKDGVQVQVQVVAPIIIWKGKKALLIQARDVTRERELELQLQHSQRMEALGTLSSGIAHDFNNMLMALQGNVSLMLLGQDKSHPDHQRLLAMQESISDATGMTRQLLGFARGGEVKKIPADMVKIIEKNIVMFAPTRKDVIFEFSPKGNAPVEIDVVQIDQVLANLIVNSFQEMPQGGKITFSVDDFTLAPGQAELVKIDPGRYVRLTVADSGKGMPQEVQKRVFDPFFSTKDKSSGTGLGLTSAYWIIKNHAGMILVSSEVGKGTTFEIYLPWSEKEPVVKGPEKNLVIASAGRLLIIDDEEMILNTLAEMAQHLGYTVLKTTNPRQGVEIYEKEKENIDLVILDLLMPEMNGREVFQKLKEINPGVKVIICSGFSMDGQLKDIVSQVDSVINKPITLVNLSHKISRVLQSS